MVLQKTWFSKSWLFVITTVLLKLIYLYMVHFVRILLCACKTLSKNENIYNVIVTSSKILKPSKF